MRPRIAPATDGLIVSLLKKPFRLLASLKLAMPLLIVLTIVTVVGSLYPEPDIFHSIWYLSLMGLLGVSLLFITIIHAPMIVRRRGRNALIGVITTHLGILVLIAAFIVGGASGFRHKVRLIEGDITVVPGIPFVVQLDELVVEDYGDAEYPGVDLSALPRKRQDSHITLLKGGAPWRELVVAPGNPARVDGITLLPAVNEIGWAFELDITDSDGKTIVVPVRPWAPPVLTLGLRQVMAHGVANDDRPAAELYALDGDSLSLLGSVQHDGAITVDGHVISLGQVRRYTGMQIYNRPQEPLLLAGSALMFAGLVWHFYFRHRDRRREARDA